MRCFSKQIFFSTPELKGQSNKLWNTLKTVHLLKFSDTQYPSDITPLDFNKFYTTVGVNLTKDLPYDQNIELLFQIKSSISLQSMSSEFVLKKLLSLLSKSSIDQVDFDLKLLHIGARALVLSLTHLFKLSIFNSELPDEWKSANVI